MREMSVVMGRELKAYFFSPVAYVFGALFLFVVGYLGSQVVFHGSMADMSPVFAAFPVLFLLFLPALTMRLWAEERKAGTLELLLTFPITIPQLITGKFLASMIYLVLLLGLTLSLPLTMSFYGELDWTPVLATYGASLLLAAAYVSLGMFWSSITRDQIVAFLLTLVSLSLFVLVRGLESWLIANWPWWLGGDNIIHFIQGISPLSYFNDVSRGVADTGDLFYYVAFCVLFLHANALVLYHKRVKG